MARRFKLFASVRIEISRAPLAGGPLATSVSLYVQASDGSWFSAVYTNPWDDPRLDDGWRAFPGNDDRFFRARLYAVGHGYMLFEKQFEAAIDAFYALAKSTKPL